MTYVFLALILAAALLMYVVVAKGQAGPRSSGRNRGSHGRVDRAVVAERWATIEAMSTAGGAGLRNAISEADKLFDYVLKGQGYAGETMAERLKRAESRLSNRNGVWNAHKLRNAYAHEMGFDVVASQANEALREFKRGLKDLGVL